jgi:DNA repair exonuclease SbcCD ATPase subunit
VGALKLSPGQQATYFLEALDTNTVSGPQKGVSRTHTVKVYSAADHRREAVAKAEALWEQLVVHLADRMEGGDRSLTTELDALARNGAIDERADTLAINLKGLSDELLEERDAPVELAAALSNVGSALTKDGRFVRDVRRVVSRLATSGSEFLRDSRRRLVIAAAQDVKSSEQNVMYLEALLDREKLHALKELADQLKQERRDLSKLLETLKDAPEDEKKAALLKQASALRERIQDLMQRMAELSKGIRDEHLNEEALAELAEQDNLGQQLDDIEKLVREGKTEQAMAKLQELGMQMDQMLEGIDKAAQDSDEQANPELAEKFKDFTESLERTVKEQEKVAQDTQALRDRYREQLKDRVSKQGEALKGELLKKTAELKDSFKKLDPESLGSRAGEAQNDALQQLDGLESALKSDDFALAAEAAQRLEQRAKDLEGVAAEMRRRDELFQNPPDVRKASRELADKTKKSADTAEDISQKLQNLFPPPGSMLSERDRQKLKELSSQQKGLEQRAEQLQQMMDGIGELAPVFNDDAKRQLDQASQKMDQAGQRLEGRDVGRATGEQQAALEGLKGLQQQLQQQQQQGGGKGGGLPMPMMAQGNGKGNGRGKNHEKVEIPDEDPNGAPLNFRKDVMDAMKQGGPERYKDQVKRYYEELVK